LIEDPITMIQGGVYGGVHALPVHGLDGTDRLVAELFHTLDVTLSSPRVRTLHARGSRCRTSAGLFDELAAVLQFPAYFGGNWDALRDSLNDFRVAADAIVLVFSDFSQVLAEVTEEELGWLIEELSDRCGQPHRPTSGDIVLTAILTDTPDSLTKVAAMLP
jgi:RNAse (barnase) inhibitor barstar